MQQVYEKDIFKILTSILDVEQNLTGIDYLKEFIKNIAINLDVKYVLIGHPIDEQLSQIQTDVVWASGEYTENFMYQLKDTPCELVLTGERVCIHDMNVARDFPEDKLLQELGIESYVGAPVVSKTSSGVSSILVLLDDKPMKDKNFFISITDFLAIRASAEITQHNIEENLIHKVEERTLELKKAKLEIELINKNLENRVKEEIEKNQKNQEIIFQQSKMASMGEMIENIAHQWRQPLSIISTSATGLKFKNELNVLQEGDIETTMENINTSVQHLSQTIDDFRNFFKGNKIKNKFILTDTFEKTFKLVKAQFKNAKIIIVENIEERILVGLENELIQVFMNILNNARDELITKEEQPRLILIDSFFHDNKVTIIIKDNAGGIPLDILEEIFESHFTTKQNNNGTGIGLYMSKMIIEENMSGTIEANNIEFTYEDRSYQWAEFKICLPVDLDSEENA